MARRHRFHLDRDGHSVTVQTGAASGAVELLVDGKVVASQQGRSRDVTVLAAELPGDPAQPFSVHIDWSPEAGDVPICVMETEGTRDPVPYAPFAARRAASPAAGTPVHLTRWLRRLLRRRSRHIHLRRR